MMDKGANIFNNGLFYACKGNQKEAVELTIQKVLLNVPDAIH